MIIFVCFPLKVQLKLSVAAGETAVTDLKSPAESEQLFAESFQTGDLSDDNEIIVPADANC